MSGVKCPDCGLLLSRNDSLNRHMRMHRGDKPYKCEECGWSFTQKGDLIIHQRKHTGEKPFKCPLCSYSAARNACVTKHILVRHPKDDEARLLSASKRERRRAPRANTTGRKRGRRARHEEWSSEDYSEDEGEEEGEEEGEDDDDSEERGVTVTVNDADDGSGADDGDDARAAALALSQPPIRHPVLPPVAARPARLVERQKLSAPVVAVPSAAAVAGFVPADGAVEPPGVSPPASASAAAATAVGLALGWREDAVRSSGRRTASHGPSGGASAGGGAATRADAATSRGQGPSHRVAGAGGHSNDPRATAAAVSLSAAVGRQVYGAADSILSAVPPDVTSLADSDAVLPPLAKRARSATAQASGEFQSAAAGAAVGPHQAAGDVPVPLTQAADKPAVSNRKKKSIEPPKRITLEHLARASVDAPLRGSGGPGAWESMLQAAFSVEFGGLGVEPLLTQTSRPQPP